MWVPKGLVKEGLRNQSGSSFSISKDGGGGGGGGG